MNSQVCITLIFLLHVVLGLPRYIVFRENPTSSAVLYLPVTVFPAKVAEYPSLYQPEYTAVDPSGYKADYVEDYSALPDEKESIQNSLYYTEYDGHLGTTDNMDFINTNQLYLGGRPSVHKTEEHVVGVGQDNDNKGKRQSSTRVKRQLNPFQVQLTNDGGLSFSGGLSNSYSATLGNAAAFGSGNAGGFGAGGGAGSGSTSSSGASSGSPFGFGLGGNLGVSLSGNISPTGGASFSASNSLSNSASYNVLGFGKSISDSQSNSFSTSYKPSQFNFRPSRPNYYNRQNPYRRRGYSRPYGRRSWRGRRYFRG